MTDLDLAAKLDSKMHWFLNDTPELPGDTTVWLTAGTRERLRDRCISAQWDMEEFLKVKEGIVKHDLLKVRMSVGGLQGEIQAKAYMERSINL